MSNLMQDQKLYITFCFVIIVLLRERAILDQERLKTAAVFYILCGVVDSSGMLHTLWFHKTAETDAEHHREGSVSPWYPYLFFSLWRYLELWLVENICEDIWLVFILINIQFSLGIWIWELEHAKMCVCVCVSLYNTMLPTFPCQCTACDLTTASRSESASGHQMGPQWLLNTYTDTHSLTHSHIA